MSEGEEGTFCCCRQRPILMEVGKKKTPSDWSASPLSRALFFWSNARNACRGTISGVWRPPSGCEALKKGASFFFFFSFAFDQNLLSLASSLASSLDSPALFISPVFFFFNPLCPPLSLSCIPMQNAPRNTKSNHQNRNKKKKKKQDGAPPWRRPCSRPAAPRSRAPRRQRGRSPWTGAG